MTVITTPPLIVDGAGRPANGFLAGQQTARFESSAGLVTQAYFRAVIEEGRIVGEDGQPLDVPPTPPGQALRLWEIILEPDQTGRERERTTARSVDVPDLPSVPYAELVDVGPVPDSGTWVVPPFVQQLLDGIDEAENAHLYADQAEAARDGAVAARDQAQAIADGIGSGGGGGGGQILSEDSANPGTYFIVAGQQALTEDPANPGTYFIAA